MKCKIVAVIIIGTALSGCTSPGAFTGAGAVLGAGAGGYGGSKLGGGIGKTAATIGGTVGGALVGGLLGNIFDPRTQPAPVQPPQPVHNGSGTRVIIVPQGGDIHLHKHY